ncbi:WLM domain-containing protein [Sporodiniella umbellata]|nr:WLM domain-containing protein [Sporodiniella umbellata]
MATNDPVKEYKSLKRKKNPEKALELLKKVASQVKPILVKRSWTIKNLCEFFPTNPNLLGTNVNRGWKVNLRLRPSYDDTQFLEYKDILGTMLHEMVHIVRGPHDEQFYKILDELKAETELLMASGYTGDGFQSKGNLLGGVNVANHRSAMAEAAKKREKLSKIMIPAGGVRLGGSALKNATPAQMAARAAQRRQQDNIWCGGSQTIVIEDSDEESGSENITQKSREDQKQPIVQSESVRDSKRKRSAVADLDGKSKKLCTTGKWQCSACTFENQSLALACEMCLSLKPTQEDDNDLWQCPQCTLMNERKWQSCVACSFIRFY